ncbi:hypothetical protein NT239_10530 [Chitinibacter sp. SCUT-21]|uniref:hypothetical protein n=1 Tax=Chitinibacter sp. SCUT-21 TaxID=2970891 RepID=UPI0035A6374D
MLKLAITALQRLGMLTCCAVLSACASAGGSNTASQAPLIERVIVQFKAAPSNPAERITQMAQKHQLGLMLEREMGGNFYVAALKPPKTEAELQPYFSAISQEADVTSIEADIMMHTMPAN